MGAASVLLMVGKMDPKFLEMLVSKASKDKILRYVNEAEKTPGVEILVDGRNWAEKEGFWVGPTIIKHTSKDDSAVKEEIFGPVLSVLEVATFDEALAIENANPY